MFHYIGRLVSFFCKKSRVETKLLPTAKIASFFRSSQEIETLENNLIKTSKSIKFIIDPPSGYFLWKIFIDIVDYDKLILINSCEPIKLNNIQKNIIKYADYFAKIYSSDPIILNKISHSELFCFGTCWVLANKKGQVNVSDTNGYIDITRKDYKNIFSNQKTFKLSFIKSKKRLLPGHKLRHQITNIIEKKRSYELLFPQNRIESKIPLFIDSMFHIAIENSQETNYFTEKIIDCFISYTVPIYWGCPNIDDFFDSDGIITFSNQEELASILDSLTPEDYFKRLEMMNKNKRIAEDKYVFFSDRLNEIIKGI
ncbi:MAG: hypothetical protein IGQ45_09735 [Cyanobacterium sp. T60_A2020_053]|nr:hypothetical protein [Cyanobacterium sp. T60_A2020_053]